MLRQLRGAKPPQRAVIRPALAHHQPGHKLGPPRGSLDESRQRGRPSPLARSCRCAPQAVRGTQNGHSLLSRGFSIGSDPLQSGAGRLIWEIAAFLPYGRGRPKTVTLRYGFFQLLRGGFPTGHGGSAARERGPSPHPSRTERVPRNPWLRDGEELRSQCASLVERSESVRGVAAGRRRAKIPAGLSCSRCDTCRRRLDGAARASRPSQRD